MTHQSEHKESETPWKYNEQRYAKLVNLSGDLKLYGWIALSLSLIVGTGLILTGMNRDLFLEKLLAVSFGIIFIFAGGIIKMIWHTVSEVIKLFIDIANDISEIRLR